MTTENGFLYFRGRVGLAAILKAIGIGSGDDVVIQAFTCVAVPEAVLAAGGRPVFADVGEDGVNLDLSGLAERITGSTRAIVVQHTFGIPVDMTEVMTIASQFELPVIEDCCHIYPGPGSGGSAGTAGAAAFYSFEWGKPVVVGIGGSVVANGAGLGEQLERHYASLQPPPSLTELKLRIQYHAHRLLYRPSFYWPVRFVYHATSALGLAVPSFNTISAENPEYSWRLSDRHRRRLERRIETVAADVEHARNVAKQYDLGIPECVARPPLALGSEVALARYPLLVDDKAELLATARRARVELSSWYASPVHPLPPEQYGEVGYVAGSCPRAERSATRIVSLPLNTQVGRSDIDRALRLFNRYR